MTREAMDVLVGESIRDAVSTVCETMLGCSATAGTAGHVQDPLRDGGGVLALLGMAGPWVGTGALLCEAELACKLAGALLMTEYDTVDDDVLDAVAEIANMVLGTVKVAIEGAVGSMGLSTPTTLYGDRFNMRIGGHPDWLQVPIALFGGELRVFVRLAPSERDPSDRRFDMAGHIVTRT